MPVNGEALVIAAVESVSDACITTRGSRAPAGGDGPPRDASCSRSPTSDQVDRLLGSQPLRAFTPFSLVDADAVRARLALVRHRLWEDAPNEALLGINVLAAPILREGDQLVGIIGVIGSTADVPSPPKASQRALVQGAAAMLSGMLGSTRYRQQRISAPAALKTLTHQRA